MVPISEHSLSKEFCDGEGVEEVKMNDQVVEKLNLFSPSILSIEKFSKMPHLDFD